jgi:cytidylate kinase
MAVITISRQFGSGGDEIANQLGDLLGYRHFDKRQISLAAVEAGISDQECIDFSEENYNVKTFFDRLFGRLYPATTLGPWREDENGYRIPDKMLFTEENALDLVKKAIQVAYRTGNMIILGRGGQFVLKDQPGVFHIRIEAPMEDRIQRIKTQLKSEQKVFDAGIDIRRKAQDMIVTRDYTSADYIKHFYDADWADPLHYHLVLNTGLLSYHTCVTIIADMIHHLEPMPA